jgi:hypothetical protein
MGMSANLQLVANDFHELRVEQVKDWIESGQPRSVIDALITPEIASLLLQYNDPGETNRHIRRRSVNATVASLKSGEWENTGEPIIMSDSKLLNDGQHRLQAIIEAGVPAVLDLRFGIKRRAFRSTNSGRSRSAGDALQISGKRNPHHLSIATRLIIAYEDGLPGSLRGSIPNGRIVDALDLWPDIEECMHYSEKLPKRLRIAATQALGYLARKSANEATVLQFFEILLTGEGKANNPPHQYREWLFRRTFGQGAESRTTQLAVGIIAWNAYRKGVILPKLEWNPSMPFPKVDRFKH